MEPSFQRMSISIFGKPARDSLRLNKVTPCKELEDGAPMHAHGAQAHPHRLDKMATRTMAAAPSLTLRMFFQSSAARATRNL
jgi:hypothetical protein